MYKPLVFGGDLFFEGLLAMIVFFLFGVLGEDIAFDLLGLFGVWDIADDFTGNVDILFKIEWFDFF